MTKDWKLPIAVVGAGVLVATALVVRPISPQQEIRLTDRELIRVDAATGKSQACTIQDRRERCVTVSEAGGQFAPHIRQEMRELGVRDVVRAKLRGE